MRLGDLDALKKALEVTQYNDIDDLMRTERLIDNAPTVEPETSRLALIEDIRKKQMDADKAFLEGYERGKNERPQGEWIVQRLQNGFDDVYCPFCNARPTRSEYGYYLKDNFCHECGADMRVKKNELF